MKYFIIQFCDSGYLLPHQIDKFKMILLPGNVEISVESIGIMKQQIIFTKTLKTDFTAPEIFSIGMLLGMQVEAENK